MAQDDLADDFDWYTGTRGVRCGMSTQIVWTEFDTDHFAGFDHHDPGSFIGNREYPIIVRIAHFQGVFTQSICHFLWDKNKLIFLAAFRFTQDQFSILQIAQFQFQHFTNPHAASGHQFEDQSIANLGCAEDDFVDGFFFDDFPPQRHPFPIQLANHGSVAGVPEFGIDIVADEIEK